MKIKDYVSTTVIRKALQVSLATLALAGLSACNTVDGVGQDVERAGEAVQDATR